METRTITGEAFWQTIDPPTMQPVWPQEIAVFSDRSIVDYNRPIPSSISNAKGEQFVNTLRVVLFILAAALLWPLATAAQVNPFGDSLDLKDADIAMLQAAASTLFQNDEARIGQTETWSNPKTGNSGAVSLLEVFKRSGMPCKRVQHSIKQKGRTDQIIYQFARCRAADGSWKLL